ncbi:hypothetical protein [Oligella sp. HMSC09E12]|uniref:hypothetical protein n=1 Tax=Oligella sp. HMSC09E12 TaxID=1581147 RepID=UPI0008A5E0AB|nr:hypothetical protein [Oligella sp. HMSC09E12]OFV49727.1 hypothetical protein HMPREF3179_03710 [Oligella sp. HMSC09E12]
MNITIENAEKMIGEYENLIQEVLFMPFYMEDVGDYTYYPATRDMPSERSSDTIDDICWTIEDIRSFYDNEFQEFCEVLEETPKWKLAESFESSFGDMMAFLGRTDWYLM